MNLNPTPLMLDNVVECSAVHLHNHKFPCSNLSPENGCLWWFFPSFLSLQANTEIVTFKKPWQLPLSPFHFIIHSPAIQYYITFKYLHGICYEKLIVTKLLKFPALYRAQIFIIMMITAFWGVMPCSSLAIDISEKPAASIFRVEGRVSKPYGSKKEL
jgi:hypothetical protein